jgi:hypothetical protein
MKLDLAQAATEISTRLDIPLHELPKDISYLNGNDLTRKVMGDQSCIGVFFCQVQKEPKYIPRFWEQSVSDCNIWIYDQMDEIDTYATLTHELVHARQALKEGGGIAHCKRTELELLLYGYWNSPIEIEARNISQQLVGSKYHIYDYDHDKMIRKYDRANTYG